MGVLVCVALACARTPTPVPHLSVDEHPVPQTLDYDALLAAPVKPLSTLRQGLVKTATSFQGAPAKPGGGTPDGFDCTGYVFYVYEQAAQITLPRKSHDQVQIGKAISPIDLQPADLIYFSVHGNRSFHVGLYLGEGRFIHAPSSGGTVRIENLGTQEWRTRFLGARRILPG